jgi:hypothetical protein
MSFIFRSRPARQESAPRRAAAGHRSVLCSFRELAQNDDRIRQGPELGGRLVDDGAKPGHATRVAEQLMDERQVPIFEEARRRVASLTVSTERRFGCAQKKVGHALHRRRDDHQRCRRTGDMHERGAYRLGLPTAAPPSS